MSDFQCAVILLAAGSSSRMGSPKQLLDFHGEPLLRHAATSALASGCGPVIVVLGSQAEEIRQALSGLDVEVAINAQWEGGMGTSIQAGLRALGDRCGGAILALADQPFVTPEILGGLVTKHLKSGRSIVAAKYSGTVGVPAFFARQAFSDLLALGPDQGCKGVILRHGESALLVECPEAAVDVDTAEDYRSLGLLADQDLVNRRLRPPALRLRG